MNKYKKSILIEGGEKNKMKENEYLEQKNDLMGENLFMKNLLKKRLNQKGLTLIELLAVIVILAIIAAIAVPAIGNIINNSRDKAILAETSNILAGARIAKNDNECLAPDANNVVVCQGAKLNGFVEGLTLVDAPATINADNQASASYDEDTGVWTVTYGRLLKIKNATKFDTGSFNAPASSSISDTDLADALEK